MRPVAPGSFGGRVTTRHAHQKMRPLVHGGAVPMGVVIAKPSLRASCVVYAARRTRRYQMLHMPRLADTIDVSVRDASDETNRAAIRTHLQQIATAFASGSFEAPLLTHAEVPPGIDVSSPDVCGQKRRAWRSVASWSELPARGRRRWLLRFQLP